MNSKKSILDINSIKINEIEKGTRVVVRQTDLRTKLFQECRISRRGSDEIEVVFREFGGEQFKINVLLSSGRTALISPDLTWRRDVHLFLELVMAKVSKMLAARKSTAYILLERRIELINSTKGHLK